MYSNVLAQRLFKKYGTLIPSYVYERLENGEQLSTKEIFEEVPKMKVGGKTLIMCIVDKDQNESLKNHVVDLSPAQRN